MPGSINTAAAPVLRIANAAVMKSVPKGTSITIRIPGPTPQRFMPRAIAVESWSSCRNVVNR